MGLINTCLFCILVFPYRFHSGRHTDIIARTHRSSRQCRLISICNHQVSSISITFVMQSQRLVMILQRDSQRECIDDTDDSIIQSFALFEIIHQMMYSKITLSRRGMCCVQGMQRTKANSSWVESKQIQFVYGWLAARCSCEIFPLSFLYVSQSHKFLFFPCHILTVFLCYPFLSVVSFFKQFFFPFLLLLLLCHIHSQLLNQAMNNAKSSL